MLQSTQACETAEVECESVLEHEQSGTLPSTGTAEPQLCGTGSTNERFFPAPGAHRMQPDDFTSKARLRERQVEHGHLLSHEGVQCRADQGAPCTVYAMGWAGSQSLDLWGQTEEPCVQPLCIGKRAQVLGIARRDW